MVALRLDCERRRGQKVPPAPPDPPARAITSKSTHAGSGSCTFSCLRRLQHPHLQVHRFGVPASPAIRVSPKGRPAAARARPPTTRDPHQQTRRRHRPAVPRPLPTPSPTPSPALQPVSHPSPRPVPHTSPPLRPAVLVPPRALRVGGSVHSRLPGGAPSPLYAARHARGPPSSIPGRRGDLAPSPPPPTLPPPPRCRCRPAFSLPL